MRIAQITDLHLNDFLARKYNIDAKSNFLELVSLIAKESVDRVVLTGDFGEPDQHQWVLEKMKGIATPLDIVLGNHDHIDEIGKSGLVNQDWVVGSEYYYTFRHDNKSFIFLDSSTGEISPRQLEWLGLALEMSEDNVLLFCHHPILDCNHALDIHLGMKNRKQMESLLVASGKAISVFCGHYHCHLVSNVGRIKQYVAPAVIMQTRGEGESILTESFDYGFLLIKTEVDTIDCEPILIKTERQVRTGE